MTAENLTARLAPGDAVRFGNFPPWYNLTAVEPRHLTLGAQYAGPEQRGARVVRRSAGGAEDLLCTDCASVSQGDSAVAVTEDLQRYLQVGDGVLVGECNTSAVIKHTTATSIVLADPSPCEASDAPLMRDSFALWESIEGGCCSRRPRTRAPCSHTHTHPGPAPQRTTRTFCAPSA